MSHVGSLNSPDGRYTVTDDTLPHQIRLYQWGTKTRVTCVCLLGLRGSNQRTTRHLATIEPHEDPWPAYDEHTAAVADG